MLAPADFAELVRIVAEESDADRALDRLALAAMERTSSRNVMIALMDEERGSMELDHGHGKDWSDESTKERIRVSTRAGEGIVAYVAATTAAYVSNDTTQDPKYRDLFGTSASEIAVPVRDRQGRIRAVLNIESDEKNHYDDGSLLLCETLAGLIALVLEREQMARREEALVQIGSALNSAMTGEELIERVLRVAGEVLRFQSCSIFLLDPDKGMFLLRGTMSVLKDRVGQVGYKPGEGITGWVCQTGQSVRLAHPQKDPRWRGQFLELPNEEIASFLAVPIIYRGRTIGVIRVLRRITDNPYVDQSFTEDDERLLGTIAEQVATGLENIRSLQKQFKIEQMAAWGELSAKSSHMIGNRVFALKGDVNELGHLLESAYLDREPIKAIQTSLGVNVTRIEEILQDFRDFLTATQLTLVVADINEVVKDATDEVFPRRSPVKLEYDFDDNLPQVKIDRRKLGRAISELVENSLNFFTEGKLRVSTHLAEPRSGESNRKLVAVEVEDEGPGVDAERKDLIFRPFYSSRVKGMGLGLSIVKGIIEAHGGTVFEDGRPGHGARFVILLPAVSEPQQN